MAETADPYASANPSEPKGRVAGVLTLVAVVFLIFVIAKVAGTISSNSAAFEEQYAVAVGDNVTVMYTIRSAATGEILSSSEMPVADDGHDHAHAPVALRFEVGSGGSGFGLPFERAVFGHFEGQTVTWGPINGAEAFGGWARLNATFGRLYGPFPLVQSIDVKFIRAYEHQIGRILNEGEKVRIFGDFQWGQQLLDKTNESVLVRHDVRDGDSFPWEVPPSTLVLDVNEEESTFVIRLEAKTGETFVVQPNSRGAAFFAPGSYRYADVTEGEFHFEYSPAPDPVIVDQRVLIEIKILAVSKETSEQ